MLSYLFVYLLLLFIPSQLGLHIWLDNLRVSGLKVDYLSLTIYFSHLLIFFILLTNLPVLLNKVRKTKTRLLFFTTIASLNLMFSQNLLVSLYRWLEIYLLIFLYFVLTQVKVNSKKSFIFLFVGQIIVFLGQILQQFTQSSVQGIFYWLGERQFDFYTPNIPKVIFRGYSFLRAPSTFSHANSLAGFSLVLFFYYFTKKTPLFPKTISLLSIILTFSKNTFLGFAAFFIKNQSLKNVFFVTLLISFCLLLFPSSNRLPLTISSRLSGYQQSKQIIHQNFWFGVGFGGYTKALELILPPSHVSLSNIQPVHNLFLLILSEFGIVGFLLLVALLFSLNTSLLQNKLIFIVFATGLFDHYWMTSLQNKIIFVVLLALFSVKYHHE